MKSILIPMMSSGLRQTANLALKADHPPSGRLILAKRLPIHFELSYGWDGLILAKRIPSIIEVSI